MIPRAESFHFYRGRVALYALARALGVGSGDEVVVQAFTCAAVPGPLVRLGARPVYVDIDARTFNLDPGLLAGALSPRTRAIVVQHTFGIPADLGSVLGIARRHGIPVIEDCCHVLGSQWQGIPLGTQGDAAFTSHEFGKPLVIGLGGVAVAHRPDLVTALRHVHQELRVPGWLDTLRVQAQYLAHRMLRRPGLFWAVRDLYQRLSRSRLVVGTFEPGEGGGVESYDRRMAPSLERRLAVLARGADRLVEHRRWLSREYEKRVRDLGIEGPQPPPDAETVYLRFPILARDKAAVLAAARTSGVELGDWFATPIDPLQAPAWGRVGYEAGRCPVAEEASARVVTLPLYERIDASVVDRTIRFLAAMQARSLV
jgi:perosamine synthetase